MAGHRGSVQAIPHQVWGWRLATHGPGYTWLGLWWEEGACLEPTHSSAPAGRTPKPPRSSPGPTPACPPTCLPAHLPACPHACPPIRLPAHLSARRAHALEAGAQRAHAASKSGNASPSLSDTGRSLGSTGMLASMDSSQRLAAPGRGTNMDARLADLAAQVRRGRGVGLFWWQRLEGREGKR